MLCGVLLCAMPLAGLAGCSKETASGSASAAAPAGAAKTAPGGQRPPSPGPVTAPAAVTEPPSGAQPSGAQPSGAQPSAPQPSVPPSSNDFEPFWQQFRTAFLSSDLEALARMTKFPVRALGETQGEPEKSLGRVEFPRLVRRLLTQDAGKTPTPESHAQYLRHLDHLPPDAVQGPTARVGDLRFALEPEGWRFVSAYLSDPARRE